MDRRARKPPIQLLCLHCALPLSSHLVGCGAEAPFEEESATPAPATFRSSQPAPIDDEDDLAAYVAQCEAALGPIPAISCDPARPAPGTHVTRIPIFLDGRLLAFGERAEDAELLRMRSEANHYECDFPSLGGDFPCSAGSTLVQYTSPDNPNVQWVGLCRGVGRDVPSYDRFIGNGLIGANELTGEMCFFFGANPDPDAPYDLPPLSSSVASAELAPWLSPRSMPGSCLSCHPNNDPWILTPWLQPSYMRSLLAHPDYPLVLPEGVTLDDVLAARYIRGTPVAHKALLPEPLPPGRSAWTEEEIVDEHDRLLRRQYRAVGSSYVSGEANGTIRPRTGLQPASWKINFRERLLLVSPADSCANGCHALANEHFDHMALDSMRLAAGSDYGSQMRSAGWLASTTWMPPVALGAPIERASVSAARVPAITECPIPHRLEAAPSVAVACDDPRGPRALVRWEYDNRFGRVPSRDDVRFDVAHGSAVSVIPSLGVADNAVEGARMDVSNGVHILRDVAPSLDAEGVYEVDLPLASPSELLSLRIQPKRYCFEEPDRRPFAFAVPYALDVDAASQCH